MFKVEDFYVQFSKCQTCYSLEPHSRIWCPEVPFCLFLPLKKIILSQIFEVILLSFHQLCIEDLWNTHSWCYAVKVPEFVCRMWQKLPFIREKMGHINFDDFLNSMSQVISAKCFHIMFREISWTYAVYCDTLWLVIIPQTTRGQKPVWYIQQTRRSVIHCSTFSSDVLSSLRFLHTVTGRKMNTCFFVDVKWRNVE